MNSLKLHSKNWGLLASTLLLGVGLSAQAATNTVHLFASDPTALEGTTTGAFTLVRTGDTNDSLSVDVEISGTASNGVDYAAISTTLIIPPGFLAVDVPVTPIIDNVNRGNKTVVLTVQDNAAFKIKGNPKATVKIVDDVFDVPPPTVTLAEPADGAVITAPATITITADVSDSELPIASVSFYSNDGFIGRVTSVPYTLVVTKVPAGHYALFARVEDTFGKSSVSGVSHVTVSADPVVTLTSPFGNTALLGDIVELDANIGDTNEDISSVSFYNGNKLLGTVTSTPFTFQWQTTADGTFNLKAVATDKKTGKKGTSAVLPFTVSTGAPA